MHGGRDRKDGTQTAGLDLRQLVRGPLRTGPGRVPLAPPRPTRSIWVPTSTAGTHPLCADPPPGKGATPPCFFWPAWYNVQILNSPPVGGIAPGDSQLRRRFPVWAGPWRGAGLRRRYLARSAAFRPSGRRNCLRANPVGVADTQLGHGGNSLSDTPSALQAITLG